MQDIFDVSGVVVIKVGSSTLVDENNALNREYIARLCDDISYLKEEGYLPILVSSGAVAAGMERLHLKARPGEMPLRQACAAAGQAALTELYAEEFKKHRLSCGQVLLTRREMCDRDSYLNARNTLGCLLKLGAIPIINENDSVSVAEFSFGDNDMLGAIVATLVNADHYIILSDVDGLYTANPQLDPSATRIPFVDSISEEIYQAAGESQSLVGTGGMASKLRAARAAMAAGIVCTICNGSKKDVIRKAVAKEDVGTRFESPESGAHESARKLWIGLADVSRGTLYVDNGAKRALLEHGASLLPVGITKVEGSFTKGDVVTLLDMDGNLLGRGTTKFDSEMLLRIRGLASDVIARFVDDGSHIVAVHRDDMLVF